MTKKWIYIALLFLLTANIALVSTLLVSNNKAKNIETSKTNHTKHPDKHRGDKFLTHITQKLGFSEEQKQDLQVLSKEYRKNKHEKRKQMFVLKQKFIKSLSAETPDSTALKLLADSLGKAQSEIFILEHNHFRSIRALCNEEQALKLDSLGQRQMHRREFDGSKVRNRINEKQNRQK